MISNVSSVSSVGRDDNNCLDTALNYKKQCFVSVITDNYEKLNCCVNNPAVWCLVSQKYCVLDQVECTLTRWNALWKFGSLEVRQC